MWKMEQVCVCPAALPFETIYMSIHATLSKHLCSFARVSGCFWCSHVTQALDLFTLISELTVIFTDFKLPQCTSYFLKPC